MTQHAVQRYGEGVGQDGGLPTDAIGNEEGLRFVDGNALREAAGHVAAVAGVDAGLEAALRKALAEWIIARLARIAGWIDAPWRAREPRIDHHPLARLALPHRRPHLFDDADCLVAEDLGEGDHCGERVIAVAAQEDLLRVAAADATAGGAHQQPVVGGQRRVRDALEPNRRPGAEVGAGRKGAEQPPGGHPGQAVAKDECFHR